MRRAGVTATIVVWSSISFAAEQAPPDTEGTEQTAEETTSEEVQEVRIVGSRDDSLQRIPGSGTVISPQEVKRIDPADTGEILRRVPGVHIRSEEGAGLRLNIGIRGLSPTRSKLVQVLEDGIPIALNPYGEPDLYYGTPAERVAAVEVVKGSGSLLYGPRVIGGVVNFVTIAPPWQEEWSVQGRVGQRGYRKVLGRYGNAFEGARYVVQAVHKEGDGFRDIDFHTNDVMGKVAFSTSEFGEATLKVGVYDEWSRAPYLGLTQTMYDRDPRQPSISRFVGFQVRRYDVSLTHTHNFGLNTRLRTLLYAYETQRAWRRQNYDRESTPGVSYERVAGDPTVAGAAVYFLPTATIRDRTYDVLGVEPQVEHRFETGGVRHTLKLGARIHGETGRSRQYLTDNPTSNAGNLVADESLRTIALAAYAQDRLAFRDDIMVTPGVRVEHGDLRRHIRRARVNGVPTDVFVRGNSDFTALMPGIGMTIGAPTAHGFGGVHAGFAPPRVSQAVTSGGLSAELKPERSIQYEVGTRLRPVRALRLEATLFLMNFYNQIVFGTPAAGAQSELINGGSTRHRGVEGAVVLALGPALNWEGALDIHGRTTFSRATFAGGPFEGNSLPYAPEQTASGGVDFEHPRGPFAGATYTFVGEQFADEDNTHEPDVTGRIGKLPAYHILDCRVGYRHEPTGLTADVTMKNALDQVYIASRLPDGIHTAGFRQITVGLRWDQ